jgi:phospholipase/carboxylesterase
MSEERPRIHEDQPLATAGAPLEEASAAMIMVHGRGATAGDILTLSHEFKAPGFAFLAPQAARNTWYPYSFLAPISQNQPHLDSALSMLDSLLARLAQVGLGPEETVLLGFSQGACLATEYAARNPRPYGAIVGLSGGLIGPPGTPRNYKGSLAHVPVFLGCSDVDPHIPVERVHETEEVLAKMGAEVTKRLYPGMGHTVNMDEVESIQSLLDAILS